MKYIFIAIFLFALFNVTAQNNARVIEYFDADWVATKDKMKAVYYRTVEEHGNKYLVKDYCKSTDALQMEAICCSFAPKLVQDGKATWFYENGKIEREGMYKGSDPIGLYKSYHKNGAPRTEKFFAEKRTVIYQYWSKDGTPMLVNGTGLFVEKEEGTSLPTYVEVKDSIQISAYSIEPGKQDTIYGFSQTPPEFQGGFGNFYKGVGSAIKYPRNARRYGIQGKVFVQFIVNKKGEVEDAKVVKGIGSGCDEEALEACVNQKGWSPGIVKGKPVKMRLVLPITFKLG